MGTGSTRSTGSAGSTGRTRVCAVADDALGDHDATGVAAAIAAGEVSAHEVVDAAVRRIRSVEPDLGATVLTTYADAYARAEEIDRATTAGRDRGHGPFVGVPTVLKDNVDLAGVPTQHGSAAFTAAPARASEPVVRQLLETGLVVLAKSTLPEYGFNASTESAHGATRNPWQLDHTPGGSSGGSAALVASGALPLAHGNDGGGSIRIPAACCGLVGLKTTRGREAAGLAAKGLPVDIVGNGVLTRTVRDTAAWVAWLDGRQRDATLPDVGLVEGPGPRRRIGLVLDAPASDPTEAETRATVERTADLLESLGHEVVEVDPPVDEDFREHFLTYWAMLAWGVQHAGRVVTGRRFDARATEQLTTTLAAEMGRRWRCLPGTLLALRRSAAVYAEAFAGVDAILSPTLAHPAPPLGFLGPDQPAAQQLERLTQWATFTPANNASGGPGISLPLGATTTGLPIGVHLSAAHGDERTLLELAYELEAERPFRRIQDA
ncbi:amidase [Nocardioidaceae bacterium]|nr:amidase [Nocardioidaceae bacterium]